MRLRGTNRNFRRVSNQQVPFNPKKLFRNGEQGVHYDPSDLSTLFQDSAGTTPVTAVEQPVGLMLDKRLGLIRGPEIVLDPSFDDASKWAFVQPTSGSVSVSGGKLFISTLDGTYCQAAVFPFMPAVVGRYYEYVISVESVSGSGIAVSAGALGAAITSAGTHRGVILATTNAAILVRRFTNSASSAVVTSISVKELPGNHAFQTTAIDRPVLSNRYNLLTKTEQFNDAVWTKTDCTVDADFTTDPLGGMAADRVTEGTTNTATANATCTVAVAVPHTLSVCLKQASGEGGWMRVMAYSTSNAVNQTRVWVNPGAGVLGTFGTGGVGFTAIAAALTDLGGGWYRVTFSFTSDIAAIRIGVLSAAADLQLTRRPGARHFVWGASLVPADQSALPYQRVNTATDYDADPTKFPLYLAANGTNTWMQTNSIDFTATDKVTVFAGVRKLVEGTTSMLLELSASLDSNAGTFYSIAPHGSSNGSVWFGSRGTVGVVAASNAFIAPTSVVVTGIGNISADRTTLRVNGVQRAQSTNDQGTGNYGNYPLYLFRRGGTNLPFNGNFYGLLIRGSLTSDPDTLKMERWLSLKTGVQL